MAVELKKLKTESVVQQIINTLTQAIVDGDLKPGDQIPTEIEMVERMGVARSSVREAVKILTYLGVLESKRSEGTFVCSGFRESMIDPMVYGILLNQDSFEDLMELRQMLETGTMRLAVQKRTEDELRELWAMVERMRSIAQSGEDGVEEFFQADNAFHDLVQQMGKNPLADKVNRVVRTLTHAMRYETVSTMLRSGRGLELAGAHAHIYEILETGDVCHLDENVRSTYFREVLEDGGKKQP